MPHGNNRAFPPSWMLALACSPPLSSGIQLAFPNLMLCTLLPEVLAGENLSTSGMRLEAAVAFGGT
jgi:hypothetical protein